MSYEQYTPLFDGGEQGQVLRPLGRPFSFSFSYQPKENMRCRLFTVGETAMHYQWKCEDPTLYHEITDSLNSQEAEQDRFALDFSADEPFSYIKKAYKKLMWPPVLIGWLELPPFSSVEYGIYAKADGLSIQEGGYVRIRMDVRYKKDGVSPYDMLPPPDERHILTVPQGTYAYTKLFDACSLPVEKVASIGFFVEGTDYTGKLYFESPFLMCGAYNMLPDFAPPATGKESLSWTGQHLSRKEWPVFRVTLNGTVIHEGEIFERCHRHSDWAITVPDGLLSEQNTLEYALLSDYHDALPYHIFECGLVATEGGVLSLVATSPAGAEGDRAYALLRTGKDGVTVHASYPNGKLIGEESYYFEKAGLHGISFLCPKACHHATFVLTAEGRTVMGEIPSVFEREEDRVITGTGDAVYIAQSIEDMEEYLAWYIGEHIGSFITFRPVYRWCGSREMNPAVWEMVTRVLNEMGMKYVLLTDGRELPGQAVNPLSEELEGEGFLGRQQHERDGQVGYWGTGNGMVTDADRQLHDMITELRTEHPMRVRASAKDAVYVGERMYLYADPTMPRDMRAAAARTVEKLASWRSDQTRHTGPSLYFKYLYEAGLTWLGAETMYSGMEALLAYLRGFAKAKGLPTFGVHHAMQWSSVPHDTPEKYRRFRLALYASYLLGATDINTEEGLWRIEEFFSHFHRFDDCCRAFTKEQQDFYRYTCSHTRKGTFHTPIALLHGRFDGRTGFGYENMWGSLPFTDAEKSWDLLHLYFPLDEIHSHIHAHHRPEDRPLGYHSGTPYGQIDVLPVEYSADVYKDYRLLAFAGYNCAQKQDLLPLLEYVRHGGRLLLSWAHLTHTTDYDALARGELAFNGDLLGLDAAPQFASTTVNGQTISVCTNAKEPTEILSRTDDGQPLLCRYRIGCGDILLYNVCAYPAHPAICEAYTATLQSETERTLAEESVMAICKSDVAYSIYKSGEETHLYFLAMDWYRDPYPLRTATLRLGDKTYPIHLPFGTMVKCVTDGKTTVWCHTENGEVLSLANGIRVQGTGKACFSVAVDGKVQEITVDFHDKPIKTI